MGDSGGQLMDRKPFLKTLLFWGISAFLFLTIIFSTSLHLFWSGEATLYPWYFVNGRDVFPRHGGYQDMGMLRGKEFNISGPNAYKLSSFVGDCGFYMLQAENSDWSVAPYKYRLVGPFVARIIHMLIGLNIPFSFVIMNIICALLIGIGFTQYLICEYSFSKLYALLGGLLVVTSLSVTRTLPFPMLEPIILVAALFVFWALRRGNAWLFLLASAFGVLTKEIFIIASPLWFIIYFDFKNILSVNNIKNILISLFPFFMFVAVRTLMGGGPLEVEFGHNVMKGDLPQHYLKIFTWPGLRFFLFGIFSSFGAVWIGILMGKKDRFTLLSCIVAIPLTIIAALFMSGRIARHLGILFPVLIPPFLMFLGRLVDLPALSRSKH